MRKNNRLQRVGQIATWVLSAVFFLIVCLFGYTTIARALGNPLPTVFGWGNAVVLSGSMEPELPVGALLLTQKQETYSPGDVVIYENENGTLVTHRLVSITGDEAVTKGDANNSEDTPFPASQIYGKVKKVLPGVGSTILWLKTPPGICMVLLVGGILIILPGYLIRKVGKTHDGT